jgi:hypothetical protein
MDARGKAPRQILTHSECGYTAPNLCGEVGHRPPDLRGGFRLYLLTP